MRGEEDDEDNAQHPVYAVQFLRCKALCLQKPNKRNFVVTLATLRIILLAGRRSMIDSTLKALCLTAVMRDLRHNDYYGITG